MSLLRKLLVHSCCMTNSELPYGMDPKVMIFSGRWIICFRMIHEKNREERISRFSKGWYGHSDYKSNFNDTWTWPRYSLWITLLFYFFSVPWSQSYLPQSSKKLGHISLHRWIFGPYQDNASTGQVFISSHRLVMRCKLTNDIGRAAR